MAITTCLFREPVADGAASKKNGIALLGFGRHHKSVDVTAENTSLSQHFIHKHKGKQPPLECNSRNEQPPESGKSAVFDRCFSDAMQLKARLRRDNSKPATRFRFAIMKRVIVPPVSIPKSIAEHRGSKDFVGGLRVPFTRCMWETEKMRQQLVLRRLYMFPIVREDTCLEV